MQGWSRKGENRRRQESCEFTDNKRESSLYLVIGLIAFITVGYILSIYVVGVHAHQGLKN